MDDKDKDKAWTSVAEVRSPLWHLRTRILIMLNESLEKRKKHQQRELKCQLKHGFEHIAYER